MKTKLLKKLRKEAKERIYLIPWKLSGMDKQVIVKKTTDCFLIIMA